MTLRTHRSPEDVFDLLADMRNAASWDPGVVSVTRASDPASDNVVVGTVFLVEVRFFGRSRTIPYTVTEYRRPGRVVLTGEDDWIRSVDTVTVVPAGPDTDVTYDAVLELKKAKAFAFLLDLTFRGVGRRAEEGLTKALIGPG
jgi:carbon monoxide dehydrogenase subunit G